MYAIRSYYDRMFSDAPPSREAVRTSRTWPELVEVKILTSSGIRAPAMVPQVMIAESFHHREVSVITSYSIHYTKLYEYYDGSNKFAFVYFSVFYSNKYCVFKTSFMFERNRNFLP